MPKQITVKVLPDGRTIIEFGGFQGPSCLEEAARLRQQLAALGVQADEETFEAKPELAVSAAELEQIHQRAAEQE